MTKESCEKVNSGDFTILNCMSCDTKPELVRKLTKQGGIRFRLCCCHCGCQTGWKEELTHVIAIWNYHKQQSDAAKTILAMMPCVAVANNDRETFELIAKTRGLRNFQRSAIDPEDYFDNKLNDCWHFWLLSRARKMTVTVADRADFEVPVDLQDQMAQWYQQHLLKYSTVGAKDLPRHVYVDRQSPLEEILLTARKAVDNYKAHSLLTDASSLMGAAYDKVHRYVELQLELVRKE